MSKTVTHTITAPASIRASAIGNAVFLSHPGASGDVASWGAASAEQAQFIAEQLNNIFDAIAKDVESVLYHLHSNVGRSVLANPEYYRMLSDRLLNCGFQLINGEDARGQG